LYPTSEKLRSDQAHGLLTQPGNNYSKGSLAEKFTAEQLASRGETILARNYRGRGFELDILTINQNTLTVVEVKYRNTPSENLNLDCLISTAKKKALQRGVLYWLGKNTELADTINTIKLDLVVITTNKGGLQSEYHSDLNWKPADT